MYLNNCLKLYRLSKSMTKHWADSCSYTSTCSIVVHTWLRQRRKLE